MFSSPRTPARRRLARCLAALAVCAFLSGPARAGTVRTMSGETFEGDVRFDNGAVTVAVTGQPTRRIDVANVLRADFSARKAESDGVGPGVQLRSGAVVGGKFGSIDADAVHIMAGGKTLDFPLANVARVIFAPLPDAVSRNVPAGFVGAILPRGDLFEGEFRGLDEKLQGAVKINSPFMGVHRFNLQTNDILAVALRDVTPPAAPDAFRVQSLDGSAYGSPTLLPSADGLTVRDPLVGQVKIAANQVAQIMAGPARALPLGPLRANVGSVLPAKVPAAYKADALPAGGPITLGGRAYDGGIAMAAGVAVTFAAPQGFTIFIAQVGLPEGAPPGTTVVFALLADGRPVWRSQPVAGGAAPLPVRWNLGSATRALTLVVEASQPAALGTLAAWGDATLLK